VLYISTQNGCDKKTSKKEDDYENDIKERILAASLQHVPSYGWTIKALAEGMDITDEQVLIREEKWMHIKHIIESS